MAADERIKIIFHRVFVRRDSDGFLRGNGEFSFLATAGGTPIGDPSQIFEAIEGNTLTLPQPLWSGIVDVASRTSLRVVFRGFERDVFSNDDLGAVIHTFSFPFSQQRLIFRHGTPFYLLDWEAQLAVGGTFGVHPPTAVFATRQNSGSVTCTTVSGATFDARMEFHPVRPVPAPPPVTVLPNRPVIAAAAEPKPNDGATTIAAGDPINVVPNCSVFPVLGPPNAAPAGVLDNAALDRANFVNARNASSVEFTFFQPASLAFTDTDPRLEWRVVSLDGTGNAQFLRPDGSAAATTTGRKIMVFGTAEGEVRLECRFQGALFATYRALTRRIRQVACRFTILNGTTAASIPRAGPADVVNHLAIANRLLRQLALELVLDANPATTNGAVASTIPGIFRIRVSPGLTRNVANTDGATIRNHRQRVMNFVYIHSDSAGNLGAATDFPTNGAGASITDPPAGTAGTQASPSTSWVRPTGVGIGADATTGTVTMNLIAARQRPGNPNLFAMFVTDGNGGGAGQHATPARQREYANTIAHEFGHILNLGHRIEGCRANTPSNPTANARDNQPGDAAADLNAAGIFFDQLFQPPHENVMHFQDPGTIAQDFDLIQARGVHQSPIVTGATVLAPAVPPGPAPPRGDTDEHVVVKGEFLEMIARRHGMTAMELFNFDGGTGIPNSRRLRSGDPNLIFVGERILVPRSGA